MASVKSKIERLRKIAANNHHEIAVEDLTELAALGDPLAIPIIREIAARYNWPRSRYVDGVHVAPMGRWAEVVCQYLEGGCDELLEYAHRTEPDSFYFAVAVLRAVKTSASVLAVSKLAREVAQMLPDRKKDAIELADAINLMISFKKPPSVTPETSASLREFLHTLLCYHLEGSDCGSVICALRGVGDEESIRLISALPKLAHPWEGIEASACRAIRKRLKDHCA